MNKIAHYLQEHLVGEVLSDKNTLEKYSTDNSIFTILPMFVVFPQDESDVRKTARFVWQLADRVKSIQLTPRGFGCDESGGAIGTGVIMDFSKHMQSIVDFDPKTGNIVAQPGVSFEVVSQVAKTHGRFLPSPKSPTHASVGGAVGNNSSGSDAFKYGQTKHLVNGLRVVLSNGDVITTRRLNKKELNKKMGEGGLEAKIYRELDKLIEENQSLINSLSRAVTKNASGYDIGSVKTDDGSFDISPLIVGSQGTLGIVTEASLATIPVTEPISCFVANFDDASSAQEFALELAMEEFRPRSIEMVDGSLLQCVHEKFPNLFAGVVEPPFSKFTLVIELDNPSRQRKKLQKIIQKHLEKLKAEYLYLTDPGEIQKHKKILDASDILMRSNESLGAYLPIINDACVPLGRVGELLDQVNELYAKNNLKTAFWGHFGDGHLQMCPLLDLAEVVDRQKIFRLMDSFYDLVISYGGSITSSGGDGRLRAPYLRAMYPDAYVLFEKIKQIFDPKGVLNSDVKIGVDVQQTKRQLRKKYSKNEIF